MIRAKTITRACLVAAIAITPLERATAGGGDIAGGIIGGIIGGVIHGPAPYRW